MALPDWLPRWLAAAGLVVFFLVAMVLRSYLVWRRTGVNPVVLPRDDSAHGYIGRAMRWVFVGLGLDAALIVVGGAAYDGLGRLHWLERPALSIAGLVLLAASILWVVVAQAQMGASFRIGIDTQRSTELVEHGLYRRSRNPIYVGMMAALVALLLLAPNGLSLLVAGLGWVLIHIQTRLEEEHLLRLHGERYAAFRGRVPRWL